MRPKGWEEVSYGESTMFERYLQWSEDGIKPIEERYVNIEKGYFVKIPQALIGKITVPVQQGASDVQNL